MTRDGALLVNDDERDDRPGDAQVKEMRNGVEARLRGGYLSPSRTIFMQVPITFSGNDRTRALFFT